MASVTWYGTLTFGLVSIPVGVVKAQDPKKQSFRQLCEKCDKPISMHKVCEDHGKVEVVRKGYEHDGAFYPFNEADLDELAPDNNKIISIDKFIEVASIDPLLFDRTYYLAPAKESAAREGYVLLLRAMEETGQAAVAKFVNWGKENLCTVRPSADGTHLVMDLVFYAEDIRPSEPVSKQLDGVTVDDESLALAVQIIESKMGDFEHETIVNEHRARVKAYLAALVKGKKPAKKKAAIKKADPSTLLAALKASVEEHAAAKKKGTVKVK